MFDLAQIRRTAVVTLVAMVMVVFAPTVSKVIAADRVDSN
jgi:hypothetical protein